MINIQDERDCCGCSACASACPVTCISMVADDEGFSYPSVDSSRCIGCGRCERVCPFLACSQNAPVISAYAARSCDDFLWRTSSSGGVFTELCKPVLETGGVVYGVSMSEDCRSCHTIRAENEADLAPMRGSKYLQANVEGVYEQVKADLSQGRRVLFMGTPCQANALSAFLGGKRNGLIIVDCVCHGVPSPLLWEKSLGDIETRKGVRAKSVNFRFKQVVWDNLDGKDYRKQDLHYEPMSTSPYLRFFLRNYCLRPSCYYCRAKSERSADISIADFWGIEKVLPSFADELGASLVIIRTTCGSEAFHAAADGIIYHTVSYNDAIRSNSAEYSSVERPPERDTFFADLNRLDYAAVVEKYGQDGLNKDFKHRVRRFLEKLGVLAEVSKLRRLGSSASRLRYGILVSFEEGDYCDMCD